VFHIVTYWGMTEGERDDPRILEQTKLLLRVPPTKGYEQGAHCFFYWQVKGMTGGGVGGRRRGRGGGYIGGVKKSPAT